MDGSAPSAASGGWRSRKRLGLLVGAIAALALVAIVVLVTRDTATPRDEMPGMSMGDTSTEMPMGSEMDGTATHDMAGMDADEEMSGMDMRPVDVSNAPAMPADARGNQPLEPAISPDGAKEFELTASVIRWNILPDVQIGAYAYNQQLSGPEIRVTQGDSVRINFRNDLPEPTSVHWHGLIVPNAMDGAADVTQPAVEPGETFVYAFTLEQTGTYFYHTHKSADRQQALGLYGALIVEPDTPSGTDDVAVDYTLVLGEWTLGPEGETLAAMNQTGMLPNYFTINGKSYPETETLQVQVGERVRLRFVGSGQFIHPMHVHGGPFEIIETDGNAVPEGARLTKDTVLVGPGERYDVIWEAQAPGTWLIHCHINDHITNNGAEVDGGGGLTMLIEVT
jgi:FtsP/CotA-like multicopper oxidase with cupredoxin domain